MFMFHKLNVRMQRGWAVSVLGQIASTARSTLCRLLSLVILRVITIVRKEEVNTDALLIYNYWMLWVVFYFSHIRRSKGLTRLSAQKPANKVGTKTQNKLVFLWQIRAVRSGSAFYDASKVKVYGDGVEPSGVLASLPVSFLVDTTLAGDADIEIIIEVSEWLHCMLGLQLLGVSFVHFKHLTGIFCLCVLMM